MDRADAAEPPQARAELARPSRSWLSQPARRGAAGLALFFLEEALRSARRLKESGDSEALHDLRVALRRLRTALRIFRESLAEESLAARMKSLTTATNRSRDAEAYLAVLETAALGVGRCPALARGISRLRAQAARGRRGEARRALEGFAHCAVAAKSRLIALCALPDPSGETFARALQKSLRRGFIRLEKHLSRIRSKADNDEMHRARLWAKRLRYLIEPFDREIRKGRRTVRSLRELQDLLGELHDVQGLRDFLAPAAARSDALHVAEILKELARRERKLYKRLERDWLGGRCVDLPHHIRFKARIEMQPQTSDWSLRGTAGATILRLSK